MRECLAEETIQAYVDGELSPDVAHRAASHTAICAPCAAAVREAENELAFLADAFEPELSLPVPSERLRERLDSAIGELRTQETVPVTAAWNFKGWLASLLPSFGFAPRYAVGFASLIAVVAFAAIFATVALRQREGQTTLAVGVDGPQLNLTAGINLTPATKPTPPVSGPEAPKDDNKLQARDNGPSRRKYSSPKSPINNITEPLPGEQGYLKTIASLNSIIENNGDNAVKPSLRADYERNLALVDQAIDATRQTARRNPKDPDAAEFLYSSYQSKIDLLSTVAEQGQMVAVAR